MYVADLLDMESIILNAELKTKEDVIVRLAELLDERGVLSDREFFIADVIKRETAGSTGVSEGVAVPHARSKAVIEPAVAAMTVPAGVDFDSPDGSLSQLIFLAAIPKKEPDMVVQLMGKFALILLEPESRDALLKATNARKFFRYFNRLEAKVSPNII